jgi:hypothetical protein
LKSSLSAINSVFSSAPEETETNNQGRDRHWLAPERLSPGLDLEDPTR